jgi:hypothetical protein
MRKRLRAVLARMRGVFALMRGVFALMRGVLALMRGVLALMRGVLALMRGVLVLAAALVVTCPAGAYINLVTVPERGEVQLTIYNSEDLTLVQERRTLAFKQGENTLEFSWAGTKIDPTSVQFRPIEHADRLEVLDVTFPAFVKNTLVWHINADRDLTADVEISYFTSGLTWEADYVAVANEAETALALSGYLKVTNNSGEDYANARVRVVVGVVHLLDEIATMADDEAREKAQERLRQAIHKGELLAERKAIVKEAAGEYFLYAIAGTETIPDGWSKRFPAFEQDGVPVALTYRVDEEKWGADVQQVYTFANTEADKLGTQPLPDGVIRVYRRQGDALSYVGRQVLASVPVGDEAELELGPERGIRVETKQTDYRKEKLDIRGTRVFGYDETETVRIEVTNGTERTVELEVTRGFVGDWAIVRADLPYTPKDYRSVTFAVSVPQKTSTAFTYTLVTHRGTNAERNE